MATTLDDLKRELSRIERDIANRKKHNQKISKQIERLEDAYKKLGNIKRDNENNADKVRDNAKLKKVAKKVVWRGYYKNKFDDAMEYADSSADDFFKSIDEMHDEVGKALDRKRGEYRTGSSVLNSLNKAWNNVSGTIRNWVN